MIPLDDPRQILNKFPFGFVDEISYEYPSGKTIRNDRFINRRIDSIVGILKTCVDIINEKKSDKTDAIIYYSPSTSRALLLYLISRLKNIIFIKEESEMPFVYLRKMRFNLQKVAFRRLHYSLFDGILLMTNKLVRYFTEEKRLKKPYLLVPMTVDFSRFNNLPTGQKQSNYIAYCGTLNNKKDGVDILIEAFYLLSRDYPDLMLYLIGESASDEEYRLYVEKLKEYRLTTRVVFTGLISSDAIPELLCGASMLVLPRPISLQAEGGFPTKLGEYLATGKPVVVTRVGEIPEYLSDEVNVFMAEPGNINSLSHKMRQVLQNYKHAQEIGQKGKLVAFEHFNYETQTKKIINFIKSLKETRTL